MTPIFSICPGFLRAWAAFSVAFVLVLAQGTARAQTNDTSSSGSSGASSTSTSGSTPSGAVTTPAGGVAPDGTMESPSGEARVPPPTSIETGQPLWSAISPLRWGRLSLLSASASAVYDSNFQLAQQGSPAQSSEVGFLQFVAAFSIRKNRYSVDLQYMPSLWYTNSHLSKNWYGNDVSFHTGFALSPRDTLTITDTFHYLPAGSPLNGMGFSANFTNFLLLENPFLAQGTKSLFNTLTGDLEHVIDSRNRVNFTVTQGYYSLTAPPFTPKPNIICLPGLPFCFVQPGPPPKAAYTQSRPSLNLSAMWTHQFDSRNTLTVNYSFERDWLRGTFESDTEFQHIGVGYIRNVTPSVTASFEGGPTFSASKPIPGRVHNTVGLSGTASIFKTFHYGGGLVASVNRSYSFAGVFSDSAHTSFNLGYSQRVHTKWNFNVGDSYLIQEFSNAPRTYGYTAWAGSNYSLSRSWSVFSGLNYFRTTGSVIGYAPRTSVYGGIRWGWSPEQVQAP